MATLHIDKIIAEKVNQDDLIRLLETVIDDEMQRPEAEMNCDLIDQCVDALLEMRQDRDHLAVMVPLMQDKAFLHLIQRKAGNTARLNGAARGALIAAAILASTISVNAMVDAAFDYNILEHIGKAISASVLGPEIIGGEDDVDEPTHCARHHGKERVHDGAGAYHRKRRNRYPSTGANHHGGCRHATHRDHAHHHGTGAGEHHQERTDHQESDR